MRAKPMPTIADETYGSSYRNGLQRKCDPRAAQRNEVFRQWGR
jgi:hypothetical protein